MKPKLQWQYLDGNKMSLMDGKSLLLHGEAEDCNDPIFEKIIAAVNSHDGLVEVCREIAGGYATVETMEEARKIIAKLEGQS